MSVEIPEETLENTEEKPDLYHDPEKLARVASWSNILAWIILVVAVAFVGLGFYVQISQGVLWNGVGGVLTLLSTSFFLLIGGFFFIMLQAIAEGLYLMMDVEEHLRK